MERVKHSKWKPTDLREIRKKLGLTQQKWEKIGISPRMFRFYESGSTKVSLVMGMQ